MLINHIDNDVVDQQVLLEGLGAGDTIEADGLTWTIVAVVQQATNHVEFQVTPETRIGAGLFTFTFSVIVDGLCPSVNITDHFLGNASVQGIKALDTISSIVLDNDAYGVDIFIQEADVSDEWELVSRNG